MTYLRLHDMLPFLKKVKPQTGLIVRERQSDGNSNESGMEGDEDQGLSMAAEDLVRCIHAKDAPGVASALRAAFDILDSQPHNEGPHLNTEKEKE